MIRRVIILSLLLSSSTILHAQQELQVQALSDYVEQLIDMGYDAINTTSLLEEIASLAERPVDINNSNSDDIGRLFFLTSFQQNSLLSYIRKTGGILSVYELAYVPGFDANLAGLLSEYIVVRPRLTSPGWGRSYLSSHNTFIYSTRDTSEYPGPPYKLVSRLKFGTGSADASLIYEKDRGERFMTGGKPEYLAGYITFPAGRFINNIILGDYRARFGQGVLMWQGYSPGVSPLAGAQVRGGSRVTGHSSTDENNHFRGAAVTMSTRKLKGIFYLSSNNIDASVATDSDSARYITSFYDAGMHVTATELQKRNTVSENSAGGNISFNGKIFSLGTSAIYTHFSLPVDPADATGTYFDFRGNSNLALSTDYSLSLKNLYLFGEAASDGSGNLAFLQGARFDPDERVRLNLQYSNIARGYTSFHGQVSGKETVNNYGSSLMAGIRMEIAPSTVLATGITAVSDSWFGYSSASFPSRTRVMTEINSRTGEMIKWKVSAWHTRSRIDSPVDQGIEQTTSTSVYSARAEVELNPVESLVLKSRFNYSFDLNDRQGGWLAYHSVRFQSAIVPLTIIGRVYTYSIPSYSTRIYAWEDDLLYNPSIPMFMGKGTRTYLLIDYKKGILSSRFKWGFSGYTRDGISSTFYEYRIELRFLIRYRKA